jgi:hypothetical protein
VPFLLRSAVPKSAARPGLSAEAACCGRGRTAAYCAEVPVRHHSEKITRPTALTVCPKPHRRIGCGSRQLSNLFLPTGTVFTPCRN